MNAHVDLDTMIAARQALIRTINDGNYDYEPNSREPMQIDRFSFWCALDGNNVILGWKSHGTTHELSLPAEDIGREFSYMNDEEDTPID